MKTVRRSRPVSAGLMRAAYFCAIVCLIAAASGNAQTTIEVIRVANARELVQAIGPDRRIILADGTYDLASAAEVETANAAWRKEYDGPSLILKNLRNITLAAEHPGGAKVLARPRYANVLTFDGGDAINIKGLILGHFPEKGSCTGAVLEFTGTGKVSISNADLFGCGTYGLILNRVDEFRFSDSTIRDCSYGILKAARVHKAEFRGAKFINNEHYDMISFEDCPQILFDQCLIAGNRCETSLISYLFKMSSSKVTLQNSRVANNQADIFCLADYKDDMKITDTVMIDNNFPWSAGVASLPDPGVVQMRVDQVKGNPFTARSQSQWGMGSQQVMAKEKGTSIGAGNLKPGGMFLAFSGSLIGLPCKVEYRFDQQDRLNAVFYLITKKYQTHDDRLEDYAILKGLLIREYNPTTRIVGGESDQLPAIWIARSPQANIAIGLDKRTADSIVLYFYSNGFFHYQ